MYANDVVCEVKRRTSLAPQVFSLAIEPKLRISHEPGQCLQIAVPSPSDPSRFVPLYFSIASPPESPVIELCIKDTGGPSHYLAELEPGALLRIRGPMGEFKFDPPPGKNLCFVAGGTGIAPLRSMVLSDAFKKLKAPRAWFLHAVRGEKDPLFHKELSKIEGLEWVVAYSQAAKVPKGGFKGRITDYLRSLGSSFPWQQTEYYLCGSSPLVLDVKKLLLEKEVPPEATHHEAHVTASIAPKTA